MSHAISVMVVNKTTGKGKSGHNVKLYGGAIVKTDNKGMATLVTDTSNINIYVDGTEVYSGSASGAPRPIICEK